MGPWMYLARILEWLIFWSDGGCVCLTEKGKYCNKVIFKYMDIVVRSSFEVVLLKKSMSQEQCTGFIGKCER